MDTPKILVVGSMNMDLLASGTPKIPTWGEAVACGPYELIPGGKGSNQALAAAKLGARSTMVGCLGRDDHGKALVAELETAQVDTGYIVYRTDVRTGLAIMCVEESGRYFSIVSLGANMKLDGEAVERALAAEKFDMIMMQLEMPHETVYRTHELGARYGIPVFLDAGPATPIRLERLKGLFIISPNEQETAALTGIELVTAADALAAARQLYEKVTPGYVILKMGSRGVFFYDGKAGELMPAFRIRAVDSTAAGDTFNAALAVRLCRGIPIRQAIHAAQAAAAICVSRKGALPSIPTSHEVEMFLKQNGEPAPGRS